MTMPDERTRALIMAGELLLDLRLRRLSPEEAQRQAITALRHYPSESLIQQLAARDATRELRSLMDSPILLPWSRHP